MSLVLEGNFCRSEALHWVWPRSSWFFLKRPWQELASAASIRESGDRSSFTCTFADFIFGLSQRFEAVGMHGPPVQPTPGQSFLSFGPCRRQSNDRLEELNRAISRFPGDGLRRMMNFRAPCHWRYFPPYFFIGLLGPVPKAGRRPVQPSTPREPGNATAAATTGGKSRYPAGTATRRRRWPSRLGTRESVPIARRSRRPCSAPFRAKSTGTPAATPTAPGPGQAQNNELARFGTENGPDHELLPYGGCWD